MVLYTSRIDCPYLRLDSLHALRERVVILMNGDQGRFFLFLKVRTRSLGRLTARHYEVLRRSDTGTTNVGWVGEDRVPRRGSIFPPGPKERNGALTLCRDRCKALKLWLTAARCAVLMLPAMCTICVATPLPLISVMRVSAAHTSLYTSLAQRTRPRFVLG